MSKSQFAPGQKETIFLKFKHELYDVPLALLRQEKDGILLQNMHAHNVMKINNVQTYHNGDWHVLTDNDPRALTIRLDLEGRFIDDLNTLQAEFDTLESEELDIIAYLKRILNRAMTLTDLRRLTPNCLHFTLPQIVVSKFAAHGHLMISEEDILFFRENNKDAEALVKERMLTNLLLPRV